MFFIAYTFKGQVHVFAGQVKIVSSSSCRTSAIFKYFCPLSRQKFNSFPSCLVAPNSYDGATTSGRQIEAPSTSVIRKFPTWSPSKNTACTKVNTSLVDKEIEVLKERLELLEKQKSLAAKEQELEEMRKASGSSRKLDFQMYQGQGKKYVWFRLPDLPLIITPNPKLFSPNSEFGREKQNKIILFCYSLPTSEFGEKIHIKMTIKFLCIQSLVLEVKGLK